MKIKKLTAVLLLLLLVLAAGSALAEITPLADFHYMFLEDGLLLQKYKGTSTAVHVAGSYEIEGTAYGVTLDTASVFRNNTKITSVELDGGIRFATTEGDSLRKNSMKGLSGARQRGSVEDFHRGRDGYVLSVLQLPEASGGGFFKF